MANETETIPLPITYKIIVVTVLDSGAGSESAIDRAYAELEQKVQDAAKDGLYPAGGVSHFTRQRPHGHVVRITQAVQVPFHKSREEATFLPELNDRGIEDLPSDAAALRIVPDPAGAAANVARPQSKFKFAKTK